MISLLPSSSVKAKQLVKRGVLIAKPVVASVKLPVTLQRFTLLDPLKDMEHWLECHAGESLDITAGGPGSGCHGPNCGRPGIPHTSSGVFGKFGFKHTGVEGKDKIFEHPDFGKIAIGPGYWKHFDKAGEHQATYTSPKTGSWVEKLHDSLSDIADKHEGAKAPVQQPTPEVKAPVAEPVKEEPKVEEKAPTPEPQAKPAEQPKEPDHANEEHGRKLSDEQLASKIKDDRLLGSIYEQAPKFDGMSVADRFRYLELAALSKTEYGTSDVKPEFAFNKYDFQIRDTVPKGLSPDELRAYLQSAGHTVPVEQAQAYTYYYPKFYSRGMQDNVVSGLDDAGKAAFLKQYPSFLEAVDNKHNPISHIAHTLESTFSGKQLAGLSDDLDKLAASKNISNVLDYESAILYAQHDLALHSKNYEVVRESIFSGWAASGGTGMQKMVQDTAAQIFSQNKGIDFYTGHQLKLTNEKPREITDRFKDNLLKLKQETEDFYKAKFATKKNPNPDLSQIPVSLERGIGGHAEAYTPAAVESWTTDPKTSIRFANMMSVPKFTGSGRAIGESTIVKTKATYADVLWTYQSAAGKPGWPEEKDLKGKKEFVLFGGAVKDVDAELRTIPRKSKW
jgi:hypothetical protein